MLTLEEVKQYLRIDSDGEDALLLFFITIAKEIVEDILRYPLTDDEETPPLIKQAMLYCITNLYEKREGTHYYSRHEGGGLLETIEVMKTMLTNLRKESW